MSQLVQQLERWIAGKEDEQCEFKEAKQRFDFEELVKYCVSLSNRGGGRIVLGVTDKRPRQVVGSQAFQQPERTRRGLSDRLRLRVDFDEIRHPNGTTARIPSKSSVISRNPLNNLSCSPVH